MEHLVLGFPRSSARDATRTTNKIGAEGLKGILDSIQRNAHTSMISLTLSGIALGPEAGKHLAKFLQHNKTMLHLDLSSNPLASEGVCALLPHCTGLRLLDIADTGCRGQLIHGQLCSMLQNTGNLAHLSLSHNVLEKRSWRRIARAASTCHSLVSLSLQATYMDTETITTLAESLIAAPLHTLTELDLSDNNLSQVEAATALAHAIARSCLQVLRLNRNPLGDQGMRELADALDPQVCGDGALQHLELRSCRIGTAGATNLFQCMLRNIHLKVLRLGDNYLDNSLDISLIEQLSHVQELQLSGNRLDHANLKVVAQACARNRRRAQDEEPFALRAEVHRLAYQEVMLADSRASVQADNVELAERKEDIERSQLKLEALRANELQRQERLQKDIADEEHSLEAQRELLLATQRELEKTAAEYNSLQRALQEKLRGSEGHLCDLQLKVARADQEFQAQKDQHPLDVQHAKDKKGCAIVETRHLREAAGKMRQKLRQLQETSLIDFRP
eukprot:TRINITY_DN33339_c1_g1_i2.p1 TRINITY_DN33339_c1_g1~~TRINITY_DN33339_c1_g1_i2.p1  ORF type:complete len:506 (+),score=72.99 TRINITY_DN33339_c1_g1_i2:247-1764(+)